MPLSSSTLAETSARTRTRPVPEMSSKCRQRPQAYPRRQRLRSHGSWRSLTQMIASLVKSEHRHSNTVPLTGLLKVIHRNTQDANGNLTDSTYGMWSRTNYHYRVILTGHQMAQALWSIASRLAMPRARCSLELRPSNSRQLQCVDEIQIKPPVKQCLLRVTVSQVIPCARLHFP